MPQRTDPMAATVAENAIYELLERRKADDPRGEARAVVDEFYATFEQRDGQRRLVLTGSWEVDPAAQMTPAFAAAGQG